VGVGKTDANFPRAWYYKSDYIAVFQQPALRPGAVSQWQAELSKIDDVASTQKLLMD